MPRRDLVARRSPLRRWTRRIFGVLATAGMLAVGAVAASMILSPRDGEVAANPAGREDQARAGKRAQRRRDAALAREDAAVEVTGRRRSGASKRQRAQRRAAVDEVRGQGYEPLEMAAYRPAQTLRVLVGRPRQGMRPGLRAFFFVRGRFIGHDALAPSMKLEVRRQRDREIALRYTRFLPGDRPCCPSGGDVAVRFRWTGERLEPRGTIPPEWERVPPGLG